jgi:hypothetical protein
LRGFSEVGPDLSSEGMIPPFLETEKRGLPDAELQAGKGAA